MSSESVEEYLEAIYSFNEKGRIAKNNEISNKLKVSPPSVTQMVKRLADEGLVTYEPYKGTMLTGKGMALAQKVVRKHRLLERLLYDFLGLPREKVHDQACRMEHSITDETMMALCDALNKPETCIDMKPIPECNVDIADCADCSTIRSKIEDEALLTTQLAHLKPGEGGKVAFIRGGGNSTQRIIDMGLTPGTYVKMTNAAPFRGPVEVEVRGTSLALGRRLAGKVFIHVEDDGQPWVRAHPHGPHHKNNL
ncbi:MAG: metal-dependent transcriptional regulator [Candidatus Bathyarchaeota archaeon]|nr:metal-dependent transcriptional regulator [Candidatus Bathyarchaeota archaeon]